MLGFVPQSNEISAYLFLNLSASVNIYVPKGQIEFSPAIYCRESIYN
jgi:hypothetical protein